MFPDSDIARQFSCGEKKCAYLCCFGLAPHFRELLLKAVGPEPFVLLFDESMNTTTKSKQMDLHVRFGQGEVATHYLDSKFMGHAKAGDLIRHFEASTERLSLNKLVQVSMDGPNVNWRFYRLL